MVETIHQKDWTCVYYSVGLGKFFNVCVHEDSVHLKNAFTSMVEQEFDHDYFTYFVENSEFVNIDDYDGVYESYIKIYKQNITDIESTLLDIKMKCMKQEKRCDEMKSQIQLHNKQSSCAFEKQKYDIALKAAEKRNAAQFKLKEMEDELEILNQKKQKLRKFRDKIKELAAE